jgi:hypothetical protein
MSQPFERIFANEEIQKAFNDLNRKIMRSERAVLLGSESAKVTLQLSSPIKTRSSIASTEARIARVAEMDAEYDRIMQEDRDEEHAVFEKFNSPTKKTKRSNEQIESIHENSNTVQEVGVSSSK